MRHYAPDFAPLWISQLHESAKGNPDGDYESNAQAKAYDVTFVSYSHDSNRYVNLNAKRPRSILTVASCIQLAA
jgi:hypothetical protein